MIIKDVDGDLWEERHDGVFACVTQSGVIPRERWEVEDSFGPVEVYGLPRGEDTSAYRITYSDGFVKYASRRSLTGVLGTLGYSYRSIETIERCPEVEWADVTAEFLK